MKIYPHLEKNTYGQSVTQIEREQVLIVLSAHDELQRITVNQTPRDATRSASIVGKLDITEIDVACPKDRKNTMKALKTIMATGTVAPTNLSPKTTTKITRTTAIKGSLKNSNRAERKPEAALPILGDMWKNKTPHKEMIIWSQFSLKIASREQKTGRTASGSAKWQLRQFKGRCSRCRPKSKPVRSCDWQTGDH